MFLLHYHIIYICCNPFEIYNFDDNIYTILNLSESVLKTYSTIV